MLLIHTAISSRNKIVQNMKDRPDMVEELKLNVRDSLPRLDPNALENQQRQTALTCAYFFPRPFRLEFKL